MNQAVHTPITLEDVARAMLSGDALKTRLLAHEYLRNIESLSQVASPSTTSDEILIASAALIELLSLRANQPAPAWASAVGGLKTPLYVVASAKTMKRLRALCDAESPLPLKSRGLLAPPDYLSFT